MKKNRLLAMLFMTISLLTSCGGKSTEDVEFSVNTTAITFSESKKTANIVLDWFPINHSIECSNFTFILKNHTSIAPTIVGGESGSRPLNLAITFNAPLEDIIGDKGDLRFHYNDITAKKEGDGEIKGIKVRRVLEDLTWEEIKEKSESGKAEETFAIGDTKIVKVNNQDHKVRIIGFNHDDLADGSGKAGITFEFANLISDSNGYSLATAWNWKDDDSSKNSDFKNSSLRKALDNGGDASITWYEKGNTKASTTYIKPVIEMLPDELTGEGILKEVKKPIATKSEKGFVVKTSNTSLFLLSYQEMTEEPSSGAIKEGETYEFYKGEKGDTDRNRIKWQVKHNEGATHNYIHITDKNWRPWNYAGYNPSEEEGGLSWLRSSGTSGSNLAWYTDFDGYLGNYVIYNRALAVAPAFCI